MTAEHVIAILTVAGALLGYLLEWRRAGATDRIAALESRVACLEADRLVVEDFRQRLADPQAFVERVRRSL